MPILNTQYKHNVLFICPQSVMKLKNRLLSYFDFNFFDRIYINFGCLDWFRFWLFLSETKAETVSVAPLKTNNM